MSQSQSQKPSYEIELPSGIKVYLKTPLMSDHRKASDLSTKDGVMNPQLFQDEFIRILIVKIEDKEGNNLNYQNIGEKSLDDLLEYSDILHLGIAISDGDIIVNLKKKAKVKKLK